MVTKHCCYGTCNSDTRYNHKPHMQGVTFLPFPQPTGDLEKCKRWIAACQRVGFSVENIKKHTYICTKHFVGGKGPTDQYPDPIPAGLEPMVLQSAITQKLTYPVAKRQRSAYVRKQKRPLEVNVPWTSQKSFKTSLSSTNSKVNNTVATAPSCPVLQLLGGPGSPAEPVVKDLETEKKKPVLTRKRRASAPSVLITPPYLKQKRLDVPVVSSRLGTSQISKRRPSGLCNSLCQSTVSFVPCISEDGKLVLALVNASGEAEKVQQPSSAGAPRAVFPRQLQVPTSISSMADVSESPNMPASASFVERELHSQEPNMSVPNFRINFVENSSGETALTAVRIGVNAETSSTVEYDTSNQTFIENGQVKVEPSSDLVNSVVGDSTGLNTDKGELVLEEHSCGSAGLDLTCQEVSFTETPGRICKVENDLCVSSPSHQVLLSVIFNDDSAANNNIKNVTNGKQPLSPLPIDLNVQLSTFKATSNENIAEHLGNVTEQSIAVEGLNSTLLLAAHISEYAASSCENLEDSATEPPVPSEITVKEFLALSCTPGNNNTETDELLPCTSIEISDVSVNTEGQLLSAKVCNNQKDSETAEPLNVVCLEQPVIVQPPAVEKSSDTVELTNSNKLENNDTLCGKADSAVSKSKPTATKILRTMKCRRKAAFTPKKINVSAGCKSRGRRKKLCQAPVTVAYVTGNSMQTNLPQNTILNNLTVVQNPNPLSSVQVSTVQLPPPFLNAPQFVLKNSTVIPQNASNRQTCGRRQPRPIAPNTSRILTNKSQAGASTLLLNNTPFLFQNSNNLQPANISTFSNWTSYSELMHDGWTVRVDDKRHFHLINNFGVTKSVVIDKDSYSISLFDNLLPADHSVLNSFPPKIITDNDLRDLLKRVKALKVCIGNPEEKFIRMVLETGLPKVKFCRIANSVYSSFCAVALLEGLRCDHCLRIRTILQHMVRRKESKYLRVLSDDNVVKEKYTKLPKMIKANKIPDEPKVYLSVAELRSKIYSLKRKLKAERQKNLRLRIKLKNNASTEKELQEHELNMPVDLDTFDKDSFCYIFIQEQIRASKCKQKGMRWHPSILRWCTNLRNTSPAGYTLLRQEFRLPSERTLCNYADARHATPEKTKAVKDLERNGTPEVQECVITIIRRPEGEECLLVNTDGTVANSETTAETNEMLKLTQFEPDGVPITDEAVVAEKALHVEKLSQPDDAEHVIPNAENEVVNFFEKTRSTTLCDFTDPDAAENTLSRMHSTVQTNLEESLLSGAENNVITNINDHVITNAVNCAITNADDCSFTTADSYPTTNAAESPAVEIQPSSNEENYTVTIVGDSTGSEVVQYIIQDLRQTVVTIDGTDYVIEEMAPLTALLDEP